MVSEKDGNLLEHGRYYAELVKANPSGGALETIQEILDRGSDRGWHLVGVAGRMADLEVILFWDTEVPSYARSR